MGNHFESMDNDLSTIMVERNPKWTTCHWRSPKIARIKRKIMAKSS